MMFESWLNDSWLDDTSPDSWLEGGALVRVSKVGNLKKFAAFTATAAAVASGSSLQAAPLPAAQLSSAQTPPLTGPPVLVARTFDSVFGTLRVSGGNAIWQANIALDEQPAAEILNFEPGWLNAGLKHLRETGASSLPDGIYINPKSVRAARIVSHQLRTTVTPTVGIDDEGNVFLHFQNERTEAYLTLQPRAMHLFCKVSGKPNIYIDDVPFVGQKLPAKIREQLAELFAT
jgi:hypothetical protein